MSRTFFVVAALLVLSFAPAASLNPRWQVTYNVVATSLAVLIWRDRLKDG